MIYELSNTGAHHFSANVENQDVVHSGNNDRYAVISLADGVSACKEARKGAKIASEAITNLLLKKGGRFLGFNDEQIAEFVVSHVLYELKCQAKADSRKVEEYSSTIASVLFDKRSRRLLYYSLGDSIILATFNGKCRMLAMPSDSSDGCYVTTTKNASIITKAKVMDAGEIESIIICSDGAWKQMYNKNRLKPEVAELLANNEFEGLKEYLLMQDCFDDYSFISMELQ